MAPRRRCSNRRGASPALQAVCGSRAQVSTLTRMGSVWPAEDRAKKSAPASRITLSTRPLQSLPCPRMSSTTMIKDGAHLASARQTWQMNSQGEHANEPCELQGSCPAVLPRCVSVLPSSERHGPSSGSTSGQQRRGSGLHRRFQATGFPSYHTHP